MTKEQFIKDTIAAAIDLDFKVDEQFLEKAIQNKPELFLF